jgi:YtoQ family protein
MTWTVYLAGEIHSNWRDEIESSMADSSADVSGDDRATSKHDNAIRFVGPVTDHSASDDCGVEILGDEPSQFWHDRKGAGINSIRTRALLEKSDIVVVKFGDKYRQWNAAFDAGYAIAKQKPLIVIHPAELQHALKEIDAAAAAVCERPDQVAAILHYVIQSQ